MHYDFIAIPDRDVPRAVDPLFQHVLDTYASETDKVISVWRGFAWEDLDFRPHPKSSTVADILKHQLRRVRGHAGAAADGSSAEDAGAGRVHPADGGAGAAAVELLCRAERPVVAAGCAVLRPDAAEDLGLLEASAAYLPSPHAADGVFAIVKEARDVGVWPDVGPDLGGRRPHDVGGGGGKKVRSVSPRPVSPFCGMPGPRQAFVL